MFETITGKHIVLRKARETDDLSMLKNVWGDEAVYRWMLFQPTLTEQDAKERCRRSMQYQQDHLAWFVSEKDTDEAIGMCAIRENEPGHFEEAGICIGTKDQGKGYGTEIVSLLLDLAFSRLGAADFRYGYFRDNEKSKRVAQHFGFQYDRSEEIRRPWDGALKKIDSCILTREAYLARMKKKEHHNFLFDLDQTLLDFHASEYKALKIVLQASGLSFSNEIYQAFKAYNKSLWLELEKGAITRTQLFTMRFQDVFSRCGESSGRLDPLKVNDEFIRAMSVNGVLMEGALEFVQRVKRNIPDARIYIASNGATVNAAGRIASTGLDRYIDGLFISEDMGVTKPAAEFFDICLKKIGEPKESCIMIGDSLSSDMLGAKNASLTSVWFMPTGNIETAVKEYHIDYCASSFNELFEILQGWSGG